MLRGLVAVLLLWLAVQSPLASAQLACATNGFVSDNVTRSCATDTGCPEADPGKDCGQPDCNCSDCLSCQPSLSLNLQIPALPHRLTARQSSFSPKVFGYKNPFSPLALDPPIRAFARF